MEDFGKSALGLAATVGDLCLKIALSQLGLVAICGDGIDHIAELTTEVHVEIGKTVTQTVDILGDKVKTGFIAGGGSGVVDGKVSGKVVISIVASATATVAAETTTAPAATEAAPAKEQQPRQECPHASPAIHTAIHAAIHEGDHFPGVRIVVATVTDRIDVVDRNRFHSCFLSYWKLVFSSRLEDSGNNIAFDPVLCKYSQK